MIGVPTNSELSSRSALALACRLRLACSNSSESTERLRLPLRLAGQVRMAPPAVIGRESASPAPGRHSASASAGRQGPRRAQA